MPGKISFGPKKTFTAWGPTTIHPSTDMIHQHNLNHLESQLQVAVNKAWKAFASEPKVTFATVTVGFPAVDKYCSAALSAVKAAECVVIAPTTRGYDFYPDKRLPIIKMDDVPFFKLNSIDLSKKQKLYTTEINGIEVTTYGEPFKIETHDDILHRPKTKHINDYPNAKSPLGRTNKQHKLIMDMNKKKKR